MKTTRYVLRFPKERPSELKYNYTERYYERMARGMFVEVNYLNNHWVSPADFDDATLFTHSGEFSDMASVLQTHPYLEVYRANIEIELES